MGKNMVQEFVNQNYLIIENNVVTNVCLWDGDTTKWTPPANSITLVQSTTPAIIWILNSSITPAEWQLTEVIGQGDIGFTWDGTAVTTNQPKPPPKPPSGDQPNVEGLQSA